MRLGQSSLESMLVVAIGLTAVVFLFIFSQSQASSVSRIASAQDAVNTLSRAADALSAAGPLSQDTVEVNMPDGLVLVNISGNRIVMEVRTDSGVTDVYATTVANVTGGIYNANGRVAEPIYVTASGLVVFGSTGITCTPSVDLQSLAQGASLNTSVLVQNVGGSAISGLTTSLSGTILNVANVSAPNVTSLAVGANAGLNITYTPNSAQAPGTYTGQMTVTGGGNNTCTTSLTFNVVDNVAPTVSNTVSSPASLDTTTNIVVNATGTDNTGGSGVALCQIDYDWQNQWTSMTATGSGYGGNSANVTYNLGYMSSGSHNVGVRCIDAASNVGAPQNITVGVWSHGCGYTITTCQTLLQPYTRYCLNANLSAVASTCFPVTASYVTLECQNNSITGTGAANTYGVFTNQVNTSVDNCRILTFKHEIFYNGSGGGGIVNDSISGSATGGYGIYLNASSNSLLIQNVSVNATGTAGDALYLDNSGNNVITLSTLNSTSANAVNFTDHSDGNNLTKSALLSASARDVWMDNSQLEYLSGDTLNTTTGAAVYFSTTANSTTLWGDVINTSGAGGYGVQSVSGINNTVSSTNITTSGSAAHAVYLQSASSNWTITNSTLNTSSAGTHGIYLAAGTVFGANINLNNVNVTGSGSEALYLVGSGNNTLNGNSLFPGAGANGVNLTAHSDNNTVTNNSISATNLPGIDVDNSALETITLNVINTTTGPGIFFNTTANRSTVWGNTINTSGANGYGIECLSGYNNTVSSTNISTVGSTAYGIYLLATAQNWTVYNNTVNTSAASTHGIYLAAGSVSAVNISSNTVNASGSGNAVYLVGSNNNTIASNKLYFTTGNGINLSTAANNNSISANTILSTSSGAVVALANSINNYFTNNTLNVSTGLGFFFSALSNLTVVAGNTINASGAGGVGLLSVSGHNNTVANNTIATAGSFGVGLNLSATSQYWTVNNNTINTAGTLAHGIYLSARSVNFTSITHNTITVNGSAVCVNISGSFNNSMVNNSVMSNTTYVYALDISAFNNTWYYNNITNSALWYKNGGSGSNEYFNTSGGQGNYYWNVSKYTLTFTGGWATGGASYPFNSSVGHAPNAWSGNGTDNGPSSTP